MCALTTIICDGSRMRHSLGRREHPGVRLPKLKHTTRTPVTSRFAIYFLPVSSIRPSEMKTYRYGTRTGDKLAINFAIISVCKRTQTVRTCIAKQGNISCSRRKSHIHAEEKTTTLPVVHLSSSEHSCASPTTRTQLLIQYS